MGSKQDEWRQTVAQMVAKQFVEMVDQMEQQIGFRRDLVIDGLELALQQLREQEPTRQ